MPCYTVNEVSVAFQVGYVDLLQKAATSLGYSWNRVGNVVTLSSIGSVVKVDLAAGRALAVDQGLVNELKRAYSQQAIKLAAKLGGWAMQSKTATRGLLLKGVF